MLLRPNSFIPKIFIDMFNTKYLDVFTSEYPYPIDNFHMFLIFL